MQIRVIGAGVMGRGIAQWAVVAGHTVELADVRQESVEDAVRFVGAMLDRAVHKQRMTRAEADSAAARLRRVAAPDAAGDRLDLVVEAVREDLATKTGLFTRLEEVLPATTVFATNTSSLQVTRIASTLRDPSRLAGLHFFNPVPLMRIVEVVPGARTRPDIVPALVELVAATGHRAVVVADSPGFLVNHAGRGLITEALGLLEEGVADAPTIDRVARDVLGLRMGPFELTDLTGTRRHRVGDRVGVVRLPALRPVAALVAHREPRRRRTARAQDRTRVLRLRPRRRDRPGAARTRARCRRRPVKGSLGRHRRTPRRAAAEGAGRRRSEAGGRRSPVRAGRRPGPDVGHDGGLGRGRAGPPPRADPGRGPAVADHPAAGGGPHPGDRTCRGPRRVRRPGRRGRGRVRAGAVRAGAGQGPAAPRVSLVRDCPGSVAQRLLSSVVSVSASIAERGLASPGDIDAAVTAGLGYPTGPLAWADRVGPASMLTLQQHLHASTGDPRYRPTRWLTERVQLGLPLTHAGTAPSDVAPTTDTKEKDR